MGNLIKETPYSEITATLEVLDRCGLTREHLTRLRREPDYAKRSVKFMLSGGIEGSLSQKRACAILGKNFFGAEEWSAWFGAGFSKRQLRKVEHFPWNEDFLNSSCPFVKGKTIRETHFAFLGLDRLNGKPLTIERWRYLYFPDIYHSATIGNVEYVNETCNFRWYLMPIQAVLVARGSYWKQKKMLPAEYYVVSPVEEIAKLLLYHRKTDVCLNVEKRPMTNAISPVGQLAHSRLYVGFSNHNSVSISTTWDDQNYVGQGLAVSLRLS